MIVIKKKGFILQKEILDIDHKSLNYYKCPFHGRDSAFSKIYYCNTNNKNLLSQYKFGGDFYHINTGGGYNLSWHKIIVKKIKGVDIVFELDLKGDSFDTDEVTDSNWGKTKKEQSQIMSINYLNNIKVSKENLAREKKMKKIDNKSI